MPVNARELLKAVSVLSENRHMKVAVKESFKAGCVAGASTMVGGLLMGPPGVFFVCAFPGGIIGVCSAAAISHGKFKPVAHVIMHDLSFSQQERLAEAIRNVMSDIVVEDAVMLLPLLLNSENLQVLVIREVTKFLQKELGLQILS